MNNSNDDWKKWLKIILLFVGGLTLLIISIKFGANTVHDLTYYH